MICDNISAIRDKIKEAAEKSGRDPALIKLICVTKSRSTEEINEAVNCGISDIGENKVQEAIVKRKALFPEPYTLNPVKWHMIGHLQTNKVKDAVRIFDLIHSVDSLRLAKEIDGQAARINKIQDILIEVNTSGEETKFGIKSAELTELVKNISALKNIRLQGLMTIAPIVKDKEEARPYFSKLRQLQGELNNLPFTNYHLPITELSMGMTQDYEAAVEEGATMVRIGTAIFEG